MEGKIILMQGCSRVPEISIECAQISLSPLPSARLAQPYSNMPRSSGSSTPGMKIKLSAQSEVTSLFTNVIDAYRVA